MKINFKIDMDKDFENYYGTTNIKEHYGKDVASWSKGMPDNIRGLIENKSKEEAYKDSLPFFQKSYEKYEKYFKIFLRQIAEYWKIVEEEFFNRLEKITGKKFPIDEVTVYLTTIQRCPYNFQEKWFMVSFLNHPLFCAKIIAHELMHFHFIYYSWQVIEKQIGKEKTEDIKEALTVLLNLEFRDLFFFEDKSYEGHQKLRDFITKLWTIEKDYDKLLNKCVEFLKNNGD